MQEAQGHAAFAARFALFMGEKAGSSTKNQENGVMKVDYKDAMNADLRWAKRSDLVQIAKCLLDQAEAEGRDLNDREQERYDEVMRRLDKGEYVTSDPIAGRAYGPDSDLGDYLPTEYRSALAATRGEEYRQAFWRYVRNRRYPNPDDLRVLNRPETRALAIATDAAGGFLVPDSFERRIVQKLEENNVVRTLATVLPLTSDHKIPVEADTGEASWISEGAAFPESDPTFKQKLLTAHKLGRICKVSEELLNDSAVNLEQYLADVFGRSLGRAEEAAFVNGDGSGKPRGILLDATLGLTAASATAIAADEVIKLYHKLPVPYRARATWLVNDDTVLAIRQLKDSNGQYIWQPGLQAGQPDRLLGRPVVVCPAMPMIGSNAKSVLFGDLSYYWIADRVGRVFQILSERYADTGQVGYRLYERVDGVLTLAEAAVYLQHPA